MAKWWSVFFAVTLLACGAMFVMAPSMGWWMRPNRDPGAGGIDYLFNVILVITGIFFVLTEALLVWFMWKFARNDAAPPPPPPPTTPADEHKQHELERKLELAWTIVPAAILLYIAFAQIGTWEVRKYPSHKPKIDDNPPPLQVDVSARQFEWRIRYPSVGRFKKWKETPTLAKDFVRAHHQDDVWVTNELHMWTNKNGKEAKDYPWIVAHVRTIDVLHSFNLPDFRVKQDTLPGKIIPVWFQANTANTLKVQDKDTGAYRWEDGNGHDANGHPKDKSHVWEIACAELCGWGHYRMIGRVFVHPDENDFLAWLQAAQERQNKTTR